MRLSDSKLQAAVAAWRTAVDAETRSKLDNIWFEERVNTTRQEAFEAVIGSVVTWEDLRKGHADYYDTFVKVGDGLLPHTFMTDFVVRDLSRIDEKQKIIRIEGIYRPLSAAAISLDRLQTALGAGEFDIIDLFLRTWNDSSIRDARPAFATLKSAVADDRCSK